MKVLFVTTEMDDFVRVGGLAAVSAALPRALRSWSDVRIMLPGYRDVVEQFISIAIVGQCAPLAEMPACSLGRASTKDGLPVYVLLCPQLYDRPGNPYLGPNGLDWPDNAQRFARPAAGLPLRPHPRDARVAGFPAPTCPFRSPNPLVRSLCSRRVSVGRRGIGP